MKTVTIFLVAVTVFTGLLQLSSAASLLGSVLGNVLGTVEGTVSETFGVLDAVVDTTLDGVLNNPKEDDKTTEDIDSILLKLKYKATESYTKTKDAARNTNKFKSLITKLIKRCNASLDHIVKALNNALATAMCGKRKGLNKAKKWLDVLGALAAEIQKDLQEAVVSGNKNLLEDLKARFTQAIADIEAAFPEILADLESSLQAIFKKHMKIITDDAQTVVVAIEKHLADQFKSQYHRLIDSILESISQPI